jgi:hypothetical protein
VGAGEGDGLGQETRPQASPLGALGDDGPEQVGHRVSTGLDAPHADHLAAVLRDEEGLGRGRVPVRDLALELLARRPGGIADLLLRTGVGLTGERDDLVRVFAAEATQVGVHEGRSERCGRSRGPTPT